MKGNIMTEIEEIYATCLPIMAAHNVKDTIKNRHAFLTGLHQAWLTDGDYSIERRVYVKALAEEIFHLQTELRIN